MNAFPSCPRKWQVEAANDGRLSGKDLAIAVRHREQCRVCAEEERAVAVLKRRWASLPPLSRDPLSVRRARQRLMSALNQTLLSATLDSQPRESAPWAVLGLVPAVALATALCFGHASGGARVPAPARANAALEIHAGPPAQARAHTEATSARAELTEGVASRAAPASGAASVAPARAIPATAAKRTNEAFLPARPVRPAREHAAIVTSDASPAPPIEAESDTAWAEDAAYLSIVSALQQQRYAEARRRAKAYLLQFPNGFRRVEVLNVATNDARATSER